MEKRVSRRLPTGRPGVFILPVICPSDERAERAPAASLPNHGARVCRNAPASSACAGSSAQAAPTYGRYRRPSSALPPLARSLVSLASSSSSQTASSQVTLVPNLCFPSRKRTDEHHQQPPPPLGTSLGYSTLNTRSSRRHHRRLFLRAEPSTSGVFEASGSADQPVPAPKRCQSVCRPCFQKNLPT